MLTGPVYNSTHQSVGIHVWGITPGLEFSIIPNSYFRLEYRYLDMIENNETVFYYNNSYRKFRHEFIASLGVWF